MQDYTCCFSGHRFLPLKPMSYIRSALEREIANLVNMGVKYFGVGGALGFDTIAALTVIKLKDDYPHIKLILVLPCKNQEKYWSKNDIKVYNYIKEVADKIVYISKEYTADCMHKRNRHLVDNSKYLICYLKNKNGGTAYTKAYAESKGLTIINLAKNEQTIGAR